MFSNSAFNANAKAPLNKPISVVQNTIEDITDVVLPEPKSEEQKRSHKKAIAVCSSVLVLSTLVALFNPRFSGKMVDKLRAMQAKAATKARTHEQSGFTKAFYELYHKTLYGMNKVFGFISNLNSFKDIAFKWLCAEPRKFSGVKNKKVGAFLGKINAGIATVCKKPYNAITNAFDKISQATVKRNYQSASKKMNSLEALIRQYASKLPEDKKKILEMKLKEAANLREYFSEKKLVERFLQQESMMSNVENDLVKKGSSYVKGYRNRFQKVSEHVWNNMSFWAQDVMQSKRNIVETQGQNAVHKLLGDKKSVYSEIVELMKSEVAEGDLKKLNSALQKAEKSLQKANYSECVQYFDKKRDLVLGSAPTDILTAALSLSLSGVAISTADSKDEKISRSLTGVFPIIAGLGANMVFTAMLISGANSLLLGALTSVLLSLTGSAASHKIIGNKGVESKEVMNA